DGTVWGVAPDALVYRWNGSNWDNIAGAKLAQVSVGSSGHVWGLDANGAAWRWNGSAFILIPGNKLTSIGVGEDGQVEGTDGPTGNVYLLQRPGPPPGSSPSV